MTMPTEPATGRSSGLRSYETKSFSFELSDVDAEGTFTGFASVFGNVDKGGDVVEPGAFTKTLAESGGDLPILWQHDPFEPIGINREAAEVPKGLEVTGALCLETQRGRETHALMRMKVVKGLSIGYKAIQSGNRGGGVRSLREVALREYSPVTFPMNPLTQVTGVKGLIDELKAGRVLSSANVARLRQVIDEMESLLQMAEPGEPTPKPGGADGKGEGQPEIDEATVRAFIDYTKGR